MSADSILTAGSPDTSFSSEADGSVLFGEFGAAIGEVTGSFDFTASTPGLLITIVMDLTRSFDLATDLAGDTASGATSLALSILNTGVLLPTISLSDPTCDPNAAFSVNGGDDFSDTCTTTATFTFAPLPAGDFTLTFASNASVDLVSIPLPAAFGLFGFALAALGLGRKLRARKA